MSRISWSSTDISAAFPSTQPVISSDCFIALFEQVYAFSLRVHRPKRINPFQNCNNLPEALFPIQWLMLNHVLSITLSLPCSLSPCSTCSRALVASRAMLSIWSRNIEYNLDSWNQKSCLLVLSSITLWCHGILTSHGHCNVKPAAKWWAVQSQPKKEVKGKMQGIIVKASHCKCTFLMYQLWVGCTCTF